jgi:LysM repeat protein
MSDSETSPEEVIKSYRKRRERMAPMLLGGLAVVLLVVGVFLVVMWLSGSDQLAMPAFLSSATPSPTITPTETPVPPTATATATVPTTPTDTPTPEGPQTYIVQEGDTLTSIAEQFDLGDNGPLLIMMYNNLADPTIFVTQELLIPPADAEFPTPTPLPETLVPGQEIIYLVLPGDSLQSIALEFDTTEEAIADRNEIDDPNSIQVGQQLIVPVMLATPVPTGTATLTPSG